MSLPRMYRWAWRELKKELNYSDSFYPSYPGVKKYNFQTVIDWLRKDREENYKRYMGLLKEKKLEPTPFERYF